MTRKLLARWHSASMAHRFALAAAGLAAAAVLLISLASWWLINLGQQESLRELAATHRQFRAETVGNDLDALVDRMTEVANSTILGTGLVDSAGRETYLAPYLAGVRQINGMPIEVLFTDFEGKEIASNGATRFSDEELAWLRSELEEGRSSARIFRQGEGSSELVALAPLRYARTNSPEGALFYKIRLADLQRGDGLVLEWGPGVGGADPTDTAIVTVPDVYKDLDFRIRSRHKTSARLADLAPQYLAILLIATFLFGAVVLFGAKLAKVVTRDLERLQDFSSRFAASGLGRERAAESGSREVSSVAASINKMLDRLDEQHSTLLQEREKLSHLTEALRVADRRKDDFLAMLAHELRNPLAPIMTGAELLRRAPGPDPRVLRTSEIIARQARHMREILDDLLDMSRVTRGQITLDMAVHDFAGIVAMAVEQVRPLIEEHGHSLRCETPDEPLHVRGDRARLIQIFSNLLTNAAKYTPDGGSITLRVESNGSDVIGVVQDNGDGIAPELMPDIFQLFTQGSRTADRKQGGLGLGLALVKRLVGLHGGSIGVESDGIGKGAAFRVQLPLHKPHSAAPDGEQTSASQSLPAKLRVMVVDDNRDAVDSLAAVLELHGHDVAVAYDGATALQMLDDLTVDVFLLDIGLPGMNGYELAQALLARRQAGTARLIAITGYGQPEDRARSAEAGFHHHLVKPVDTAALFDLLSEVAPAADRLPPSS